MPNPSISFRISEFNLARALTIIRQLEPNYKVTSASHIVKTCFFDYLAKMNLNRNPDSPPEIVIEVSNFLHGRSDQKKSFDLDDLIELEQDKETFNALSDEESVITSVSDFAPPDEWKEE